MESETPKVLHHVLEKPMLVHVLEKAQTLSPDKIFLIVGKYKDMIQSTLEKYIELNNVEFVIQENAQGTGHAIQCTRDHLLKYPDHKIIILSGDVPLLRASTMQMLAQKDAMASVLVSFMENPTGYGRIILDAKGRFIKIVEEKDCLEEERAIGLVNSGVYCFLSSILCKYLPLLNNQNAQNEYYLTDILELIKLGESVIVDTCLLDVEQNIQLTGINTRVQLNDLNTYLSQTDVVFD
jgi:UDP-N-acetylglucosamine diphosphorylase/glucosamine-1-phosphate N-acetyltransferase